MHQKILDKLDDVICLAGRDGEILFINEAIKNFGIERDKIINIGKIFPFINQWLYRIYDGIEVMERRWAEIRGKKFYIEVKASLIEDVALIVIKDITQWKKMEEWNAEIKRNYEKIFEMSNEGIYIEDENGEVIFANRAFANMIGYEIEDVMGKKIGNFLKEESRKKVDENKYEVKAYTGKGEEKYFLHSPHSLKEKDKEVRINFCLDLSREMEKNEKLKMLMERERNFRLRIAHYFFNPLAIAKGYMGLMMDEVGEYEREKILKAIHAITRVENVIKNFVARGEIAE